MDSMRPPSKGKYVQRVVVGLVVVGLIGVALYFKSQLNRRQFRIVSEGDMLVIERGRFLPFGFEPYEPETGPLREIYAPFAIPRGEPVLTSDTFDDRSDLDRALYAILSRWARKYLAEDSEQALGYANTSIHRSEQLPALSEQQRGELRVFRADVSYLNGRRMVTDATQLLEKARESFNQAIHMGTTHADEVKTALADLERRIHQASDKRGFMDDPRPPPEPRPPSPPDSEAMVPLSAADAAPIPADTKPQPQPEPVPIKVPAGPAPAPSITKAQAPAPEAASPAPAPTPKSPTRTRPEILKTQTTQPSSPL